MITVHVQPPQLLCCVQYCVIVDYAVMIMYPSLISNNKNPQEYQWLPDRDELTNEFWDRVIFFLHSERACDVLVLYEGEYELNKLQCVRWSYHVQHLGKQNQCCVNLVFPGRCSFDFLNM